MNHRPRFPSNTDVARRAGGWLTWVSRLVLSASCLSYLVFASTEAGAAATSRAWLVAGEPDPNVPSDPTQAVTLGAADVARGLGALPQTFIADPTPEAREARAGESSPALQPLARVFGQQAFNTAASARRYRLTGDAVVGTRADGLSRLLDKAFGTMGSSDRGLFFYAGPGQVDPADPAGNTLRLWDNTTLSVRELDALSSHAPTAAPMRFVMTQCHSSGFLRLIRPGARDQRGLGPYNRCVFTAEPIDHLGQGCAARPPEADSENDRGYAGDFFAALAGRARADLDGDKVVSLHEAHLYAVVNGDGTDLPRSTSEAYLERWQPTWLRYLDTVSEPDNEYGRVARVLAERLRLPSHGRPLLDALETRQKDMTTRLQRLTDEAQRVNAEVDRLQGTLRRALVQRWPAAAHPYTAAYARFLSTDAGAAQTFLASQTATYPTLVAKQERLARIAQDRRTLDQGLTQLDKLLRLRQLARLKSQFDRHASPQARQDYERLSRCERLPL